MKHSSQFAAAASLLAAIPLALAAPTSNPVCIVGAGPAGLTVAHKLESKGRNVVLFEKQAAVGGKCQAVYADNEFFPLGALLFSNATYVNTLNIIDASGVPSVPFGARPTFNYNWTTGVTVAAPPITLEFEALAAEEYVRYSLYWSTIFAPFSALRYKNGVPSDFTKTCADWLAENGFTALPVLFSQAMVAFGYGDYRQVPILYMLQYLTPDILGFFAGLHNVYLIDFHKVLVNYAQSISGPINLNTQITKIDRSGANPVITYTTGSNSNPTTQQCSSLVLAFPPTIGALQGANLDISPAETTVFSPIGLTSYFSSAVRTSAIPNNIDMGAASPAPNIPADAAGEPVAFLELHPDSDVSTAWSWGPYRGNTTAAQARELLKETISRVNKDPANATAVATPIADSDILGFQATEYFPHFDPAELSQGWYGKYNKLQGQSKTYYVSGLNGMETVEFAVRAGIDIVDSFF